MGEGEERGKEVPCILADCLRGSSRAFSSPMLQSITFFIQLGSGNSLILSRITFIVVVPIVYTFRLKLLYGLFFFVIILMAWIIPA